MTPKIFFQVSVNFIFSRWEEELTPSLKLSSGVFFSRLLLCSQKTFASQCNSNDPEDWQEIVSDLLMLESLWYFVSLLALNFLFLEKCFHSKDFQNHSSTIQFHLFLKNNRTFSASNTLILVFKSRECSDFEWDSPKTPKKAKMRGVRKP